jgi:hypothetical protein
MTRHLHLVGSPEPRLFEKRSRTIGARHMQAAVDAERETYDDEPSWRPVTRDDCRLIPRPCPFVSCRHSLYLDVDEKSGGLKLLFPDLEPGEMKESCSLDLAAQGGMTLEEVGEALGCTRERVRQIEAKALRKLDTRAARRLGA